MTRLGITAVGLAVGALLWSSSANAELITLNASTGGTPVTIATSSTGVLNLDDHCCTGGGNTSVWHILANASGPPEQPSGTFLSDNISTKLSNGSGTLFLWFTNSGLTSPLGTVSIFSGLTSNELNGGVTNARLSSYISPADGIAPPVSEVSALLLHDFVSGPDTADGTKSENTGSGPYSLQAAYRIAATGPGSANLTINIREEAVVPVIPEPGTLVLLGTGVVGLAGLLRRKLNL